MYILLAQVIPERLDWFNFGISSANRTGAFIACLITFVWCLYAFRIKWLSILTWIANLVLFYFLVQTASRGALVSLTAAGIFFLFFAGFKRSRRTVFFVLFWVACALLILLQSRLSHRMEEMVTLQSSSANCRMDIYLSGLKMLTDAPSGVQSPIEAYMQWYQDPNDSETYLSMINSHLEFLCANGFLLRLGYIALWVFILSLLLPSSHAILPSACTSVWICFALCSTFSNVANYWVLWIIPTLSFILGAFYNKARLKNYRFYSLVILVSLVSFIVLHTISYLLPREAPLRFRNNGDVLVGEGIAKFCIFKPIERILGTHFGSEIISIQKNTDTPVLVSKNLPQHSVDKLIICSALPENASELYAKELVFLNTFPPNDMSKYKSLKITGVIGGFTDWRVRRAWKSIANNKEYNINLNILNGVADYIPNWTKFITDETN